MMMMMMLMMNFSVLFCSLLLNEMNMYVCMLILRVRGLIIAVLLTYLPFIFYLQYVYISIRLISFLPSLSFNFNFNFSFRTYIHYGFRSERLSRSSYHPSHPQMWVLTSERASSIVTRSMYAVVLTTCVGGKGPSKLGAALTTWLVRSILNERVVGGPFSSAAARSSSPLIEVESCLVLSGRVLSKGREIDQSIGSSIHADAI